MKKFFIIYFLLFSIVGYSQRRLAWRVNTLIDTVVDPTPPPPRCNNCLIINETFEPSRNMPPAGLNGYDYPSGGGCCSYSHVRRTDTVANFGTGVLKTELRIGDPIVGTSKRSELNRGSTTEPDAPLDRWYGISYYLPASYASDVAPEAISQWHEVSSTGSPHFALWTKSGHFYIAYDGAQSVDLGAYSTGVWYDFVFHIYWSKTSSGNFNAWMNDAHVVTDKAGANMPSADVHAPYWKRAKNIL